MPKKRVKPRYSTALRPRACMTVARVRAHPDGRARTLPAEPTHLEFLRALRAQGPQQMFRISPWLTRFVTLWSLLAFFATDLPVRAAAYIWAGTSSNNFLLWTNPANWTTAGAGATLAPEASTLPRLPSTREPTPTSTPAHQPLD